MEHSVQAYLKRLSSDKLEKFLCDYNCRLHREDYSGMIDTIVRELERR